MESLNVFLRRKKTPVQHRTDGSVVLIQASRSPVFTQYRMPQFSKFHSSI